MATGEQSDILYARPADDCVVFRVVGRGTFQNSVPLKRTVLKMLEQDPGLRFILDMEECESMDSTFMGVLASMGIGRRRRDVAPLTIVNVNEHAKRLLDTLGLSHFLEVRPKATAAATAGGSFQRAEAPALSQREQLLHIIEAHEELIDADSRNRLRFENVMKYLNESLERAE